MFQDGDTGVEVGVKCSVLDFTVLCSNPNSSSGLDFERGSSELLKY